MRRQPDVTGVGPTVGCPSRALRQPEHAEHPLLRGFDSELALLWFGEEPADDAVARFMVAMWAARNDIGYTAERVGEANTDDAPEFFYLVRLLTGHLLEAAIALNHYRGQFQEVESFIQRLSTDDRQAIRKAANVAGQVGGRALPHSRDRTFHYPSPDPTYSPTTDEELADELRRLADEDVALISSDGPWRLPRLQTADRAMLSIAMRKHQTDPDKLKRQVTRTRDAAGAFNQFARAAWQLAPLAAGMRAMERARQNRCLFTNLNLAFHHAAHLLAELRVLPLPVAVELVDRIAELAESLLHRSD